jgi:hypothetical protein
MGWEGNMRRLGVWLLGFVAAAAAVMAAAPETVARPRSVVTAPSDTSIRNTTKPRDMGAAIALLEQIRP